MKKALTVALILILVGCTVFLLAGCSANGGFKSIFTGKAVEKVTDITEDFKEIDIRTDTADITFVACAEDSCKIVALDIESVKYDVCVENGSLKIRSVDERKWHERIFNFHTPSLTVYIPEGIYTALNIDESTGDISIPSEFGFESIDIKLSTGNVLILSSASEFIKVKGTTGNVSVQNIATKNMELQTSTGDISLNNVSCSENMDLKVSTGDIMMDNITCKNLTADGTTGKFELYNAVAEENITVTRDTGNVKLESVDCKGDVSVTVSTGKVNLTSVSCANLTTEGSTGMLDMREVIASGSFDIERSTGDVSFEACDASEITVLTDTGDVTGSLLSDKIFITSTDTGKIKVPESVNGGRCKISTDTGDIIIIVK